MALPKISRIKKQKEFDKVFKGGEIYKNSLFIVRVFKNNLNITRFGFIVSQKVSKKAVERNRIKRRLSEIAKTNSDNIKSGTDILITALPATANKDFTEIKAGLENIFIKAKILNA